MEAAHRRFPKKPDAPLPGHSRCVRVNKRFCCFVNLTDPTVSFLGNMMLNDESVQTLSIG